MRTRCIEPGDIVCANKKGRLFFAKVIAVVAGDTLSVQPIERNISYRQVKAREITDHWAHGAATRRADRAPQAQIALDLPNAS